MKWVYFADKSMVRVRVEGLSKRFGDSYAVKAVNFEVNDEEFYVILGPSGCGKTTTLNMIAGLVTPDEGKVYFDEKLVNDLPPEKRDIAMVFQSYALYPHYSAHDNIAFPLRIRRMKKEEIERKVEGASAKLGITHLLKKKPHELSGGERQRVALARAIVRDPQLFLLDEPLSNIDAKLRQHMRAELIALQNELKITTVYVTHDQVEAMTMADRLMVMNNGEISQIGKPLEVYQKPANLFVAGFMGTPPMNFFDCAFKKVNDHYTIGNDRFSIPVSDHFARQISKEAPNSEFVLGARPQDLLLASNGEKGDFDAVVYAVETLGGETIVDVKVGDNIYKVVGPATYEAPLGKKISVKINASNVHIFDRKTGESMLAPRIPIAS